MPCTMHALLQPACGAAGSCRPKAGPASPTQCHLKRIASLRPAPAVVPLLAFYTFFVLVLHPLSGVLHFHGLHQSLAGVMPTGLIGLVKVRWGQAGLGSQRGLQAAARCVCTASAGIAALLCRWRQKGIRQA